jgi:hypothetical protein
LTFQQEVMRGVPPRRGGASQNRRAASSVQSATAARNRARKPTQPYRLFLSLAVLLFVVFILALLWLGGSYYSTPLSERVFHPQHSLLKPSGRIGHGLGVAGTAMMLLIFLYPLRKRSKILQKVGTQSQWLQVHIALGIAGPVLVTFHSTGKLGGLVAIAFYSMWAIVASGFFGRYLYAKIPRTVQGNKMTLKEIETQLAKLVEALHESERREEVLAKIEGFLAHSRRQEGGLLRALGRLFLDDLQLPLNMYHIWRIVGKDHALSLHRRLQVSRLVLKQRRALDKLAVLDASQQLFSYWHIFHRPFTVMTFVIVSLHVAFALYLGFGPQW